MMSLFPSALAGAFDLSSPQPSSPDTIHVDASYTLNDGDTLDLAGSPGFKLEVRPHTNVTLDINGVVTLDGGDRQVVDGVLTSESHNGDATVTIGATGSLTVTGDAFNAAVAGALMLTDGSSFANNGTVQVTAAKGIGGGAVADETTGVLLANNGVMTVEARIAYGLYMLDDTGQAVNNASLAVSGHQALGIYALGGADAINNGSMRVTGADAGGMALQDGSGINNGEIRVLGHDQVAGVEVAATTGFTNNGDIVVTTTGADPAYGLLFNTASGGLLTNNGTIRADVAAAALEIVGPFAASNDVLLNNGKLDGDVMMGGGSDGISNVGKITGDIDLGDGGDILISNRGYLGGMVFGGLGNDNIEASRGDDTVYGDEQNDALGGGDDMLRGMKGADTLIGGQGTDTLIGGAGTDQLTGGAGDDVFKFTKLSDGVPGSADLITDLTNTDVIDLRLIDAVSSSGTDDAFHIVGAFTGSAGELALSYEAGKDITHIAGDVDGDGNADFEITVSGDHSGFTNFVL